MYQIKSFVVMLRGHQVVVEDSLVAYLHSSHCDIHVVSLQATFSPSKSALLIALRHKNSNIGSSESLASIIPCFWEYPKADTSKKGEQAKHTQALFPSSLPDASQQVTVVHSMSSGSFHPTPFPNLALGAFNKLYQATISWKQSGTNLVTLPA